MERVWRPDCARRRVADGRLARLRRPRRPVRLRQVDVPAHAARPGATNTRNDPARRRSPAAGARPGSRRRLPTLLRVSASDRPRQRAAWAGTLKVPLQGQAFRRRPPQCRRRSPAADCRSRPFRRRGQISGTTIRRHAAAPGAGAGPDHEAEGAAARRALWRARSRHPRRDPHIDEAALARNADDRRHGDPRHARSLHAGDARRRLRAQA